MLKIIENESENEGMRAGAALERLAREGARRMPEAALEAEVALVCARARGRR
jgi:hypothetical protein